MMKRLAVAVAVLATMSGAGRAWGVEQNPQLELAPAHPAERAGVSLAAAVLNVIYFPARFALTIVTAELGGFTGMMTGGDRRAAEAVWDATEGQGFITPAMLEGREAMQFGR
jgi:hypothetical protein